MSKVPVGISNRHVHLSLKDLETLFGPGATLTVYKELSQPGQYAAEEMVDLIGPKGTIKKVRILGPLRKQTQVEISATDARALGVNPPVRESGQLAGSAPIVLEGPKGRLELSEGVILAHRHIHLSDEEAKEMGFQDKDVVKVKVEGIRGLVFDNVIVRVNRDYRKDFHIDTDEANAAGLKNGDLVEIMK